MNNTPIDRLAAAKARVKVCHQEIAKLRDPRSRINPPKISTYREHHGCLPFEEVQLIDTKSLRAFLIGHFEAEALRYERVANRLRFEVLAWADEQKAKMQDEIATFNAERLK